MAKHAAGLINKPSKVNNVMANYYQRRNSMDISHARHVPREAHHMINRRVMLERPGNYKYPDEIQRSERENLDSQKRRLGSQEKQRTTRDVWDNGGPTPRDASGNDITADDASKLKGKEGPREKQRLTQDLERQRKKLKEDMKRGQELQREHNQLLTRDQMHDQPRDITNSSRHQTSEDVPTDDRADNDWNYNRRQYDHNGTAEYSENNRNISEKRARVDAKSAAVGVNGAGSGDEMLKRKLDPCDCTDSSQGIDVNKHRHRMSDVQCEHSSSRENHPKVNGHANDTQENHEHIRNTRGVHEQEGATMEVYSSEKIEVIGESSDFNETSDEKSQTKTREKGSHKQRKWNEGKSAYDEYLSVRKQRRTTEGTKDRCGSMKTDKGSLKDNSSGYKRSSCSDESVDNEHGGNKRNKNQEGSKKANEVDYESDATQNRVRSDFPRHNWLVERYQLGIAGNAMGPSVEQTRSTESFKEIIKESEELTSNNTTLEQDSAMQTSNSPVFEQPYKDEVLDEGYNERISDDELVIAQNEILQVPSPVKYENESLGETNHSPNLKYSQTKQEKRSPRNYNNCSPEIKQYSPTVGSSPDPVQSSPKLLESSHNLAQTSPSRDEISLNRVVQTSNIPESPNRLQATSCGTPLSHQKQTSPNQVEDSPNQLEASPHRPHSSIPHSPNTLPSQSVASSSHQISPHRVPNNTTTPSPNQVPHSPNGKSSLPDRVVPSPKRIPAVSPRDIPASPHKVATNIPPPSPNRVPQSPNRVPQSPNRVPQSPNRVPQSPNRVPQSPNRIPEAPNRALTSPNDRTTKRQSPSSSVHSFETRQISPRFIPRSEQDLAENYGQLRTAQDRPRDSNEHSEHIYPGGTRRERLSEDKIIEVTSDGEESKRGNIKEDKEVAKIQTGRSVNPVTPIVRSDKYAMEEMHAGIHEPPTKDIKPQRLPADLPPGLPFMTPAYVPGYPPKTFTPHLITHNTPGMRHPGHPAIQGSLPGRLELSQHTKPDMNCPFHGKKDKMHPHITGYPVLPADAHMYPQHPLHDKLRDKRSEHLDMHSDPLAMQRRLSVYDRHLIMPHGIPIHHPRYLAPGIIDEHGFPLDAERYKHRLDIPHPYNPIHKPQSHTLGGVPADTSRYVGSPSEEKRLALKYMEDKRDASKDIGMQSENYRHHHREQSLMTSRLDRHDAVKRFNTSPQDTRTSRAEHSPRTRPESPGKYSPPTRHVKEAHPGYIQLGQGKKEKTGSETRPSPSPGTLDRESISRDFNERFNMLDKTFKEKLEGTDRQKDEAITAYSSAHRRHGVDVGGAPRTWGEHHPRGADPHQPRGAEPVNYRNVEKHSPNTKHSTANTDEQRKLLGRVSPRELVTSVHSSNHKPTVRMPYFHGNLVPSSAHGFGRGMVGVPVMANPGDFAVWQGMRGPPRIPGYPPSSNATKEAQVSTALYKLLEYNANKDRDKVVNKNFPIVAGREERAS